MDTGIFARIQIEGKWQNLDIGDENLPTKKVLEWLRSRGGHNPWAENCALALLGRELIADEVETPQATVD